ncbi:PREDICTED: anaphase-promoting complex subunit 4-like, partial [Priapulus caudatus]|uniref:Anaphase-promoting complex subunit 4 n=1 Tax=Priapulus caudatus TaxID=37621 RepID=A0ABM1DVY3_PRICU
MLSILLECAEPNMKELYFYSFNMDLLCKRHMEIQILASKFGQISSLMAYLDATITAMTEAWEDILLEMDLKLAKFAEEKAKLDSGSVSDDFLQLLMFGTCSAELQQFLLYELTEKGLKKLGHSLETSYSNVQKLVLKHLQSVTQALAYHLGDVMGMAQWKDKFGALGLTPENLQVVSRSVGSFMLKATELQQVIDNSMKNFKAFFRWLYVVILRLSDETPMAEINKVTQQDLAFVAEFLKESFTEEQSVPPQVKTEVSSDQAKPSFHLERVGQYLKDEPLHFPPDTSTNPWEQVLSENANLRDHKSHFPHDTKKSLIQH